MSLTTTPIKSVESPIRKGFKNISSPNNTYGITNVVNKHMSRLQDLLSDWLRVQVTGIKLCKAISALKIYELNVDDFPTQLQPLIDSLQDATNSLKCILEGVEILQNQLQSLTKLQHLDHAVVSTLSIFEIYQNVADIYESLKKEYTLKEVVLENIAHCRDEKLIEVYVSAWEFNIYYDCMAKTEFFENAGLNNT